MSPFLLRSQTFVSIVEIINIRSYSRKTNMLRNVYTIGRGARNISTKKWKINYFKIKIILFIILNETMLLVMDKSKSRNGALCGGSGLRLRLNDDSDVKL